MTTVSETLDLPGGSTPTGLRVLVELAGTAGRPLPAGYATTEDGHTIVGRYTITPNEMGEWTVDLVPNDQILPAGTAWRIILNGDPRISHEPRFVNVPASGGPHQVVDLLVDPPAAVAPAALALHVAQRGPAGHLPDGSPDDGDVPTWHADTGEVLWAPGVGAVVRSVNGDSGPHVVLSATDVGADAAGTAAGLVATEAWTRAAADTALSGRLDTLEAYGPLATAAALAAEATTRADADTTLDSRLDALEAYGPLATTADLADETSARTDADNALASDLADEVARAVAAEALLIPLAQKGAASGVAPLGGDSKIPTSYLPALAITDTFTVDDEPSMLALDAQRGDVAVRSDLSRSFILQTEPASTLENWVELLTPSDTVLSVDGQTGIVDLTGSYDPLGAAAAAQAHAIQRSNHTGTQAQSTIVNLVSDLAGKQPLDSDLTAIAALATASFGRGLLELADAAGGRAALGLGTAAVEAASAFDPAGAAAAAQAASQPLSTDLTAIAALTSAANKMPYATGAGTWALADLTAFARSLLDDGNAATALTTLGAVPAAKLDYAAASTAVLRAAVTGDTNDRVTLTAAGAIALGPGNAVADTFLDREVAGVFRASAINVSNASGAGTGAQSGVVGDKLHLFGASQATSVGFGIQAQSLVAYLGGGTRLDLRAPGAGVRSAGTRIMGMGLIGPSSKEAILAGTAADTDWYRDSAGVWRTSGAIIADGAISANGASLARAAGNVRDLIWASGTLPRWILRTNATAESGGNAGSDFELIRRNDDGSNIGPVLSIVRSSGAATFAGVVTATGGLLVNNTTSLGNSLSLFAVGGQGHIEMREQTVAPGAPAADRVRIYAEDDGNGKTRFVVRFATGAPFVIATEP